PHGGEFPIRDADVAGEIDGVGGADDMQVLEDAGRHRKAPFWGRWMAAETSLLQKNQTVRGRQPGCLVHRSEARPCGTPSDEGGGEDRRFLLSILPVWAGFVKGMRKDFGAVLQSLQTLGRGLFFFWDL